MKPTLAALALLLGSLGPGCLEEPRQDHSSILVVAREEKATVENWSVPHEVVNVTWAEAEGRVPAFAEALRQSEQSGRGVVRGHDTVEAVWAFLAEKMGRDYQGYVFVKLESSYHSVTEEGP